MIGLYLAVRLRGHDDQFIAVDLLAEIGVFMLIAKKGVVIIHKTLIIFFICICFAQLMIARGNQHVIYSEIFAHQAI